MANTSSARKAARRIARRTLINKTRRSRVRTQIRKVNGAINTNDPHLAQNNLRMAESEIMRAVAKGVVHRNTGARKISRLARRIRKLADSTNV